MLLQPPLVATAITWFATETHQGAIAALVVLAPALWWYVLSFPPFAPRAADTRWAARVVGWSLIAGVTLVPAATVLLAPLSGLLAFPTLMVRRDRAQHAVT
jgi:hypothetical protein